MGERKRYGGTIFEGGNSVVLVKEDGLGDGNHPFWEWLFSEGFHLWCAHGNYGCDWVFINLNSMVCAPGMPGVGIVFPIRGHAITADEFKVIWGIFVKYEGLPVLKMPEKTEAELLLEEENGSISVNEVTRRELDQWILKGEVPLKDNDIQARVKRFNIRKMIREMGIK